MKADEALAQYRHRPSFKMCRALRCQGRVELVVNEQGWTVKVFHEFGEPFVDDFERVDDMVDHLVDEGFRCVGSRQVGAGFEAFTRYYFKGAS